MKCYSSFKVKVFGLFLLIIAMLLVQINSHAETLYVRTDGDDLNGRAEPTTGSNIEAHFSDGWTVEAVGYHDGWVEVEGGETGTVFCKAEYLSETAETSLIYRNISGGRVFVRSSIEGTKIGKIKANKTVVISRILDGWGYTGEGWVDLQYFEQE